MSLVSTSVTAAILAGTTHVTRRAEIYEGDGVTPFMLDAKVKDGAVSVDYTRNDRRNVDITFDNRDKRLIHDPENGFWYDKIIRVFRGVTYQNQKMKPSIVVLGVDSTATSDITSSLRRVGMTDLTFYPTVSSLTVNDLLNFDVVIGYARDANLSVDVAALLLGCYNAGKNILSFSNLATAATVPLIATTATRASSTVWDVTPGVYDNVFGYLFASFNAGNSAGETIPLTIVPGARAAGTTTYLSSQLPAVIIGQAQSGGQWVHYHPRVDLSFSPAVNVGLFLSLLQAMLGFLYSYGGDESYETQVGEFCIDKISEPRFPHEIKTTGRDYAKRLALSKFDQTVTFSAGTSVDFLIRAEAANGGVFNCKLAGDGASLPGDLTFSRGSDRLTAIVAICAAVNQEIFFDPFGYLITRAFLDPATSPISLYLNLGGPEANLISLDKSSDDSRLFNRIICTGGSASDSVQGFTYEGIAENHEPSSPTRIERIGERTDPVDMPTFTSDDQCLAWAKRVLSVSALESYDLSFGSLVFPWLEAGEITQYADVLNSKDPDRYLLTSFNIPLGVTYQTGGAKRVSIVG